MSENLSEEEIKRIRARKNAVVRERACSMVALALESAAKQIKGDTAYDLLEAHTNSLLRAASNDGEHPEVVIHACYLVISAVLHKSLRGITKEEVIEEVNRYMPTFVEEVIIASKEASELGFGK